VDAAHGKSGQWLVVSLADGGAEGKDALRPEEAVVQDCGNLAEK
jgi:hypothetical protein